MRAAKMAVKIMAPSNWRHPEQVVGSLTLNVLLSGRLHQKRLYLFRDLKKWTLLGSIFLDVLLACIYTNDSDTNIKLYYIKLL